MNKDIIEKFVNNHTFVRNGKTKTYGDDQKRKHKKFLSTFFTDKTIDFLKDKEKCKEYVEQTNASKNMQQRHFGCLAALCRFMANETNDDNWLELNQHYNSLLQQTKQSLHRQDKPKLPEIDFHGVIKEMPEDTYEQICKKIILHYHFLFPAPLRTDLCTIKIKNFNEQTDNYYTNGKFVYNQILKTKRKVDHELDTELDSLVPTQSTRLPPLELQTTTIH
jgi:hypothetical protein